MCDTIQMLLVFSIVLIVLAVSTFPLSFHVSGQLDVFVHGGTARLYFLYFRILKVNLRLERNLDVNTIYIESFKNRKVLGVVNLTTDHNDEKSIVSILTGSVLQNMRVSDSFINIEIGRKSDAIFTAMGMTMFRIAYSAYMSFVKSWQQIRTQERFVPAYDKNVFNIEFLCIVRINIADIIHGMILQAFTKRKKEKTKVQVASPA